jgi:hypothetical protein
MAVAVSIAAKKPAPDRGEDDAGEQRGEPAAILQVQGKHEEERRRHQRERQGGEGADTERPATEEPRIDQRRPPARPPSQLVGDETGQQHRRGGQAQPGPLRRATGLVSFQQSR